VMVTFARPSGGHAIGPLLASVAPTLAYVASNRAEADQTRLGRISGNDRVI
jgi:hypothetical protein